MRKRYFNIQINEENNKDGILSEMGMIFMIQRTVNIYEKLKQKNDSIMVYLFDNVGDSIHINNFHRIIYHTNGDIDIIKDLCIDNKFSEKKLKAIMDSNHCDEKIVIIYNTDSEINQTVLSLLDIRKLYELGITLIIVGEDPYGIKSLNRPYSVIEEKKEASDYSLVYMSDISYLEHVEDFDQKIYKKYKIVKVSKIGIYRYDNLIFDEEHRVFQNVVDPMDTSIISYSRCRYEYGHRIFVDVVDHAIYLLREYNRIYNKVLILFINNDGEINTYRIDLIDNKICYKSIHYKNNKIGTVAHSSKSVFMDYIHKKEEHSMFLTIIPLYIQV